MPEQPIIAFATPAEFRRWLTKNHASHPGIWMKVAKKDSGIRSITCPQALDEALCFGWIDGQRNKCDESTFLQKYTRRGPRSLWSKINVANVGRLTCEGRMKPAGLAAVDAAKADGRWAVAYHASDGTVMPEDFLAALGKFKRASAFFEKLNHANRFAIYFRVTTAIRPETRARRIAAMVAMLKRGETLHQK